MLFITLIGKGQHTVELSEVTFNNGEITNYTGTATNIIIPENFNGTEVVSIGDRAFSNRGLTSVVLPNTLKTIKYGGFGSNEIKNINIPGNVEIIGEHAFSNGTVDSINFEDGVKYISKMAFAGNTLLYTNIPSSVVYIGEWAFGCPTSQSLKVNFEPNSKIKVIEEQAFRNTPYEIKFPTNSNQGFTSYIDDAGNLYYANDIIDSDKRYFTVLPTHTLTINDVEVVNGKITNYIEGYSDIVIPDTIDGQRITNIGDYAFYEKSLKEVYISNGIDSIGSHAFEKNYLQEINIPGSIVDIKGAAFNINPVTKINGELSNGIIFGRKSDGSEDSTIVVSYCGVSDTINFIANSVKTIIEDAFKSVNIDSVIIPNSVRYIGRTAFYNNNLEYIIIPNNVTQIEQQAFDGNPLKNVNFESNSNLRYLSFGVFDNSYLDSIELPEPIVPPGYNSFIGWKSYYDNNMVQTTITNLNDSYSAIFDPIDYSIFYENIGTLNSSYNPDAYTIEDNIYLYIPDDSLGYIFAGWFTDENFNDTINKPAIEIGSTGDKTFYAKFNIKNYTITYENIGTLNSPNNPFKYTIFDEISLEMPYDSTGHIFDGWFTDELCSNPINTPAITSGSAGDVTFYAKWILSTNIESIKDHNISVFPNPVINSVNIISDDLYTIQLFKLNGEKVLHQNMESYEVKIDLNDLNSGIYILRMHNKEKVVIKEIVKK